MDTTVPRKQVHMKDNNEKNEWNYVWVLLHLKSTPWITMELYI